MPGRTLLLPLLISAGAGVYLQHDTLVGQEAGVTFLLLLMALKLLEMRARRDVFVVIFLCFFILLTQFMHSQGPGVALMTLMAVAALFFVLVSVNLDEADLPAARKMKIVGGSMLKALPLTLVLFLLTRVIPGDPALVMAGVRGGSMRTSFVMVCRIPLKVIAPVIVATVVSLTGGAVSLPGLPRDVAQEVVDRAHQTCPYSKATRGTAEFLGARAIPVKPVLKVSEGRPNVVDDIKNGTISLIINTPLGRESYFDDGAIRRDAGPGPDKDDAFVTLQEKAYEHPIVELWNDPGAGRLGGARFFRIPEIAFEV
mgnify:CR=1 FL=1